MQVNIALLTVTDTRTIETDKSGSILVKKINDQKLDTYHRWLEVFIISSLFDLPTLTVPIGFNENGFSMGLQIIAKKGDDIKLISFAKTYEKIYKYSNIKVKFK